MRWSWQMANDRDGQREPWDVKFPWEMKIKADCLPPYRVWDHSIKVGWRPHIYKLLPLEHAPTSKRGPARM